MNRALLPYLPILIFFLFALSLAASLIVFSTLLGRRRRYDPVTDLSTYECGIVPTDSHGRRYTVRFYLVAMVFILFDLEVAFLYPWAVVYRSLGWYGFALMAVFMGVLGIGFVYVWGKGALDWNKEDVPGPRPAGRSGC
ncbi:MAG: NADH-quinone oxidoreductase subunit A [Acidobacteriota bacterium]